MVCMAAFNFVICSGVCAHCEGSCTKKKHHHRSSAGRVRQRETPPGEENLCLGECKLDFENRRLVRNVERFEARQRHFLVPSLTDGLVACG